ncbi:HpcH/HpaI aldolase family protein [Paraburkholderia caballeronis]|uniref:2-dehydro-3-deoxyglucarate aldolase/4-hydroxy-2-oxoheptanedioate aldolase n=1 Tax=Paraburkholderia caballeronis TaxID=416943 RepID=A0A1H7J8E3_9BURK|nr:aldolase/citrate lyase family protein [Paraburkholderia caballeronis]PXW27543.1 2-dehydro-3-deoxyglucarate aldolase/4-hydroxy-2-oxoheptanedioate aldolase [Paraburkholderia caballeronis]PXX03017.1 2-dehydro-3-deoxyglucarate aldolase/4-hydroxy-2-oxoheptanedioate aldolase [Paraburkholderia caballeronis]RAK03742.1 2-dehydro-3-deoxyglucarate aldolase/4-hydroxy-2-oxoheptanedioate aldolase [Paraburkholderia caballeronis]TDV37822.1 2-dehydro-3-deoxyglucarate aldolase/4-hydroxy-2-oxoheptanedioate ald
MQNSPEVHDLPNPKTLHALFAARRRLSCAWFSVGSATLFEIGVAARPDLAVIDRQHGLWDRASMEAAIGLARYQLPVVVRVAENSAHAIAEALDAGAASVLVPLVESAEEAKRAVSHGRYPPFGARSGGGVRPLLAGPAAMKADGERVSIGVMIETVAGVEQVESIAAVEGLGYLFVGTGDLALSRGDAPGAIARDCERILAAAHARGLPCGIFTGDEADARAQLAHGFDFAVAANDIDVVRGGFERAVAALRA